MTPDLWADLVGVKYVEDGRDPATGLDCLGLVLEVHRRRGYVLPNVTTAELADRWPEHWEAAEGAPRPGDAILWRVAGRLHVGVVVAPGRVLHAAEGAGVVVSHTGDRARTLGAFRPRREPLLVACPAYSPAAGMVTIRVVEDLLRPGGRSTIVAAADGSPVGAFLPPGWHERPEDVAVSLDGRRVPREAWGDVVPAAGSELVVARVPRFGVAFFAALGAEAGGALLATETTLTALGAVLSVALNVVVGIGLSIVSSALVGTPRAGRGESDEASPTYNLSGIRNSVRPGGPIPVVYGTCTTGGQIVQLFQDIDDQGRSVLFALVVLSQGEIESIDGLREADELAGAAIPAGFKINGNPASGYSGVRVSTRIGTTDQVPIAGFNETVNAVPYNVTLDDLVPFVHTTTGAIEAFQLNFNFPEGIFAIDSSGNPNPRTVNYTVEWKLVDAATWTSSGTLAITRLAMYAVSAKWRKDGLALGRYQIRVTRTYPPFPETTTTERSKFNLTDVNEITSDDLSYPDLALVGWRAVASDQLAGGIPTFTHGNVKGKRVYVWDGVSTTAPTFVKQWTDSPAWIAFDLLTRKRYGAGNYFDALSADLQSVADAETWLAESVADGRGGTFRRGVSNYVLDSTRKAWDVATELLTPYRVVPINYGNRFRFRVEKSVVSGFVVVFSQLFTMGNIVAGSFRMTVRNPDAAANVVECQYWDEEHNFEPDVEQRADTDALQAGASPRKATISLPAVTHRGRVARVAQFRLNVELANLATIEFEAALDAVAIEPGDVFALQHEIAADTVGGRLVQTGTGGVIYLDRDLTVPAPDVRWLVHIRTNLGAALDTLQTASIDAGTYPAGSAIALVDALGSPLVLPTIPQKGDVYAVGLFSKVVKYYRAVDLTLSPDFNRRIVAVEYDDAIYADDPGTVATATDTAPNRNLLPAAPTGLVATEVLRRQGDGAASSALFLAWNQSEAADCDVYLVSRGNG